MCFYREIDESNMLNWENVVCRERESINYLCFVTDMLMINVKFIKNKDIVEIFE